MKKRILIVLFFLFFLPGLTFSQEESSKKKVLYFYAEDCLPCEEVEQFFSLNGVEDFCQIERLSVFGPYNKSYLDRFFDVLEVDQEKRGWPVVVFGGEVLIGSEAIKKNFLESIEREDASSSPSPEGVRQRFEEKKEERRFGFFQEDRKDNRAPFLWLISGLIGFFLPAPLASAFFFLFFLSFMAFLKRSIFAFWGAIFVFSFFVFNFILGIFYLYFYSLAFKFDWIGIFFGIFLLFWGIYLFVLKEKNDWSERGICREGKVFCWEKGRTSRFFAKKILGASCLSLFCWLTVFFGSKSYYRGIVFEAENRNFFSETISLIFLYNLVFIVPFLLILLSVYVFSENFAKLANSLKRKGLLRVTWSAIMIFAGAWIIFSNL